MVLLMRSTSSAWDRPRRCEARTCATTGGTCVARWRPPTPWSGCFRREAQQTRTGMLFSSTSVLFLSSSVKRSRPGGHAVRHGRSDAATGPSTASAFALGGSVSPIKVHRCCVSVVLRNKCTPHYARQHDATVRWFSCMGRGLAPDLCPQQAHRAASSRTPQAVTSLPNGRSDSTSSEAEMTSDRPSDHTAAPLGAFVVADLVGWSGRLTLHQRGDYGWHKCAGRWIRRRGLIRLHSPANAGSSGVSCRVLATAPDE